MGSPPAHRLDYPLALPVRPGATAARPWKESAKEQRATSAGGMRDALLPNRMLVACVNSLSGSEVAWKPLR